MLKKTLICILLVGSVHFAMAESLNDALNRSRSGNSNNNRPQVEDLFTGDVKLACEATLCLSTGNRPSTVISLSATNGWETQFAPDTTSCVYARHLKSKACPNWLMPLPTVPVDVMPGN